MKIDNHNHSIAQTKIIKGYPYVIVITIIIILLLCSVFPKHLKS